jgi:hypothetical protein
LAGNLKKEKKNNSYKNQLGAGKSDVKFWLYADGQKI